MENENTVAGPRNWIRRLINGAETAAAKSRTWVRKLVKVVGLVIVALMALYVFVSVTWRFSGSNQWEYVEEQNGVKVYKMKTPGADLLQVKGIVRVYSTLGGVIKLMSDPTACEEYGCYDSITLERVDNWLEYGTFKIKLPFPFQAREFMVRQQVHQDPRTKELLVVFAAAPDKAPPDYCCFRVADMNNTWRLTPLENGQVEFEYIQNMDEGGFIPDLLINRRRPKAIINILSKMQGMLNKKNYQNVRLDHIQER